MTPKTSTFFDLKTCLGKSYRHSGCNLGSILLEADILCPLSPSFRRRRKFMCTRLSAFRFTEDVKYKKPSLPKLKQNHKTDPKTQTTTLFRTTILGALSTFTMILAIPASRKCSKWFQLEKVVVLHHSSC